MKSLSNATVRKPVSRTVIQVDPKDRRLAKVTHNGKVIFTIKTDASGVNPSIIVVAAQTRLKAMEKGTTGIVLWNGRPGVDTRNLKLY